MPKRIKPIEPPDSIHLNTAIGWLELGNNLEAYEELDEIAPQMRVHPLQPGSGARASRLRGFHDFDRVPFHGAWYDKSVEQFKIK